MQGAHLHDVTTATMVCDYVVLLFCALGLIISIELMFDVRRITNFSLGLINVIKYYRSLMATLVGLHFTVLRHVHILFIVVTKF